MEWPCQGYGSGNAGPFVRVNNNNNNDGGGGDRSVNNGIRFVASGRTPFVGGGNVLPYSPPPGYSSPPPLYHTPNIESRFGPGGQFYGQCTGKSKEMPYPSMPYSSRDNGNTTQVGLGGGGTSMLHASPDQRKTGSPYYGTYSDTRRRSLDTAASGVTKYPSPNASGVKRQKVYNGSEEFGQDSPRYTSPKPGLYHGEPAYFMDGAHNSPDPWSGPPGHPNGLPSSSYGPAMIGSVGPHFTQPTSTYANMHPPPAHHDSVGYNPEQLLSSGLPPMSTFRGGQPVPAGAPYSTSPSNLASSEGASRGNSSQQTGDAVRNALASIYSTDHTTSNFPSNPSTPVSSPPPMSGSSWPTRPPAPTSPHYGESHLHSLQSRMEERLDDAIHVLRNHAEGAPLSLPPGHLPGMPIMHTAHSNGIMGNMGGGPGYLSGVPSATLIDSHMASPHTFHDDHLKKHIASDPLSPDLSKECDDDDSDTDGPALKAEKIDTKLNSDMLLESTKNEATSTSAPAGSTTSSKKRSRSSNPEDDDPPVIKHEREKERRHANNARERVRVRDINSAFKELGRMVQMHLAEDKPQTKLGILHQAVSIITNLEQKVRERNLNPKAACLKRREEEKTVEDHTKSLGPPNVNPLDALQPQPSHIQAYDYDDGNDGEYDVFME
ncbi:PREDICTED: transcription factor 12-like isoform X2 [Priapulus caudatus]|uniref:Transcription factor 12-like isoform X2 n=1 Tax=Priapulus caudatus TaxID=37621 RepID=A0ABM1DRV6_PRICU|nr:PREDICTED: transcription factor 12-like isoform X2 [Priapulus caudatus]XP_014662677.1 PREDICTED: transcription factor 12-like isoform X2 [Priapulus caudatus]